MSIRVRIPPSPTGLLHVGTARTALYNYLFAKHSGGQMVLRIEDTDKERSHKAYENDIIQGLRKLGLNWDEGVDIGGPHAPYRQSERTELYAKYLKELLDANQIYYCFCSKEDLEQMHREQAANHQPPRYVGGCNELSPEESKKRVADGERGVLRLRVQPDKQVQWQDLVRGDIAIHSKEIDDMIIAKSLTEPLYNFTVVIDDYTMQITHVIRGEDHISNTPKQILLYQAFGWPVPIFGHLPLILNEDRSKLSKRKNKVSVDDYLNEGYLPEALINFLAFVGWSPEGEREIYTLDELAKVFTMDRVHKGGAVFDLKKLEWMNGEYIKAAIARDVDAFYEKITPFIAGKLPDEPTMIKAMLTDKDFEGRFKKLTDIAPELTALFTPLPDYPLELMMNAKFGITADMLRAVFEATKKSLEALTWDKGQPGKSREISDALVALPSQLGLKNGQVLWPIRVALSGVEKSPNFATLALYLGKEETLKRIDLALAKVK